MRYCNERVALVDTKSRLRWLIKCEHCVYGRDDGYMCDKHTYPHPTEPDGFCVFGEREVDGVVRHTGDIYI